MTDKQYKTTDLRDHDEPARPSPYNGRGGAPLVRHWWQNTLQAQDSAPASVRRLVCTQNGGGTRDLLTVSGTDPDNGGSGTASQVYPTSTDDRVVARSRFYQSPGSVLEVRALMLPAGPTQFLDGTWRFDENGGVIDIDAAWASEDNANTDTSAAELEMTASQLQYAALPTGNGSYWTQIRPVYAEYLAPSSRETGQIAADYSEGTSCVLTVNHRGGVRCVSMNVHERPYIHGTDHDVTESTAHDYPKNYTLPHAEPRVEAADGATYEERRFGTSRAAAVAERQAERMGPVLFAWHAYGEDSEVDASDDTISTSSTSAIGVLDSSVTAWAADEKGFGVFGHYAIPRDRKVVSTNMGLIPARVWVYASGTVGASGVVRIQTSSRSWIDVAVSEGATWYTANGYLECQRTSDDSTDYANAVPFFYANSGTIRVMHIICEYGAHDYG